MRPQVWSSNSETPGLELKYWEPRSAAQILRAQVYISWAVDLGSRYLNFRPWVSVFELQTRGLTVWTADLGSHCLNCRLAWVLIFEPHNCCVLKFPLPASFINTVCSVTKSPENPDIKCPAFVEIRPDNAHFFVIRPGFLWFSAHSELESISWHCCWLLIDCPACFNH